MVNETLEQKVNAQQKEKTEEKKLSTSENVINELSDLVNLGFGIAAPVAGYALTGNPGVLATSAAYVAGTKGKKDSTVIRNESLSGAIFGTYAHYATLPLRGLTNLGKAIYMALFPVHGNAFYMAEDHLIKTRSFSGLYKNFKENYWGNVKRTLKTIGPLLVASAIWLPQQYMVMSIGLTSFLYRKFVLKGQKVEEYEDKRAFPVAALDASSRLIKNTVKGFYDAVYAIGSSIRDLYKKSPASETKPPATSPAH